MLLCVSSNCIISLSAFFGLRVCLGISKTLLLSEYLVDWMFRGTFSHPCYNFSIYISFFVETLSASFHKTLSSAKLIVTRN